ncbi:MAG: ABC transporter permease subunit [Akkermansiaceae bacterium]|nr:ABC transporter permease subunit [Akkermansiaceae bacterium]NNM28653.1 ABC transporter permease subunit [Akkermansiaceae bacterium]
MRLFLYQLRGELKKLFSRRRTYIGYVVFLLFEAVLLLVFQLEHSKEEMAELLTENGLAFGDYYSSLTVTYWVMGFSMFMLGSIYFALVAGDIVAKESEDGNLRLVLVRPVSRLRVLLLKYVAVIIFTVTFVIFVGITGYIMSVIALGFEGGLFVWNYEMKVFAAYPDWGEGAGRLVMAALLIGVSMCTLSTIAFAFSCLKIKPAAATILALSVLFVDFVLLRFPFMQSYRDLFVTHRMSNWVYVLENNLSWAKIGESYAFLGGLNVTLFVAGWMAFQLRDFKT